jgi:DNA-binding NarL/FixJ family response regulator
VLRLWADHVGLEVVGEAHNGREAVELAVRLRPDAIILDEEMPIMTGLEAMPRLRRRLPTSTIVVYSSGLQKNRERALALGANAYLTKSQTPKDVVATVIDLLGADEPVALG